MIGPGWEPEARHFSFSELGATDFVRQLQLGEAPIGTVDSGTLNSDPYSWQFADCTSGVAADGRLPQGVLLRWQKEGQIYENWVQIVSAEAKEMQNEDRRPVWLVLEPHGTQDGA